VLAKGFNFQIPAAPFDVLVDDFLEHPGGDPFVFSLA
jgi:hypothetical protein